MKSSDGVITYNSIRIRFHLKEANVRSLVGKVILATRRLYPDILRWEFYITQCKQQIKHKTDQYIQRHRGIHNAPADQVFGFDAAGDRCRNIQACIGTLVSGLLDGLVQRLETENKSLTAFEEFQSVLLGIMEPMLRRFFDEEVASMRKSFDSEYVWTAIGKYAVQLTG